MSYAKGTVLPRRKRKEPKSWKRRRSDLYPTALRALRAVRAATNAGTLYEGEHTLDGGGNVTHWIITEEAPGH